MVDGGTTEHGSVPTPPSHRSTLMAHSFPCPLSCSPQSRGRNASGFAGEGQGRRRGPIDLHRSGEGPHLHRWGQGSHRHPGDCASPSPGIPPRRRPRHAPFSRFPGFIQAQRHRGHGDLHPGREATLPHQHPTHETRNRHSRRQGQKLPSPCHPRHSQGMPIHPEGTGIGGHHSVFVHGFIRGYAKHRDPSMDEQVFFEEVPPPQTPDSNGLASG